MGTTRIPAWSGRHATVIFNLNDKQVVLYVKSWDVERVGEWAEDDYCGEDRTHSQFITKYFSVALECSQPKLDAIKDFIDEQANQDAAVAPLEGYIGMQVKHLDGSKTGFMGTGMSLGNWKLNNPGRTQRNALNVPLRFEEFDLLPG